MTFQTAQALHKAGELQKAEALYRALLQAEPHHDGALQYLGLICLQTQRLDEAYHLINQALAIREDDNRLYHLAMVHLARHQTDLAITLLERVMQRNARHVRASFYLGIAYRSVGDYRQALVVYHHYTQLVPTDPQGWKNLGACLSATGDITNAESAFRHALTLDSRHKETLCALSMLLENRKSYTDALALSKQADDVSVICRLKRKCADWQGLDEDEKWLNAAMIHDTIPSAEPLSLINYAWMTRAMHRDAGKRFARALWSAALSSPLALGPSSAKSRLKIGYLSADFLDHATMRLLAGVLEAHNLERYDIHLYAYGPTSEDSYTRRIEKSGLPLHRLNEYSDRGAAEKIAADGVDILIDLKGYTTHARPGITACRPAPLIVNWLGYPGSLGHSAMADFIIGDPWVTPLAHAADYSETLALMPQSYQPNDNQRLLPPAATRHEAGLPENATVLCSFNQTIKYSPALFTLWSKVLLAVPHSVLWLLDDGDEHTPTRLRNELVARGIDKNRVIFAPFVSQHAHMARLQLADLALDTFPYNSHTTASDALWTGVPLVSLTGETFAGRVATSLLHAAGLPALVTYSEEDWLRRTITLAKNTTLRQRFRERLIAGRQSSALFDTLRFTRNLEKLYEGIQAQRDIAPGERKPVVID